MNKSKIVNLLVVLLIIGNLIALGIFFFGKKKHSNQIRHKSPKELIIKELNLDNSQIVQYELLIADHKGQMNALTSKIREVKRDLYSNLGNSDEGSDSFILRINALQLQIEKTHITHFRSIKKLCRPDQAAAFADLSQNLGHLFAPRKRAPGKRKKRQ